MRLHLTLSKICIVEDLDKKELLYVLGKNENWAKPFGSQYTASL